VVYERLLTGCPPTRVARAAAAVVPAIVRTEHPAPSSLQVACRLPATVRLAKSRKHCPARGMKITINGGRGCSASWMCCLCHPYTVSSPVYPPNNQPLFRAGPLMFPSLRRCLESVLDGSGTCWLSAAGCSGPVRALEGRPSRVGPKSGSAAGRSMGFLKQRVLRTGRQEAESWHSGCLAGILSADGRIARVG